MTPFEQDLEEAKQVAADAVAEFARLRHAQRVHERLVRIKVASFLKTIQQFNHAPSLEGSPGRGATKDGGAWFPKSTGGK